MQPLPSRRGSRNTLSDAIVLSVSKSSDPHVHTSSKSSTSEPQHSPHDSQVPNLLTANTNFQPVDGVSRLDTEIWGGERTASFGNKDGTRPDFRDERGLVINKRTQFTVEVDRASGVI
jgi:hypothetical protein